MKIKDTVAGAGEESTAAYRSPVEKLSVYLAKLALHDEVICQMKPSLLAACCVYLSLNLLIKPKTPDLESTAPSMLDSSLLQGLQGCSGWTQTEIKYVASKVLYFVRNFDTIMPGLQNTLL